MAGTKQCMVHLQVMPQDPQRQTYLDGETKDGFESAIFPWGSISKMVVIATLQIFINELAHSDQPEDQRFKPLQGAWKKPFVECFNNVSNVKMLDMPHSPKVEELITHYAGTPPLNHIIMAPDGTPIASKDAFPAIVHQLAKDIYGESESHPSGWHYSNGNIILIGLLIEAVSGTLLSEVVDKYVFRKLGMHSAFMVTTPDDPNVTIPYEVSPEGTVPISLPKILSDPLCIAAMGVCSNMHDMATFVQSIVESFPEKDNNPKSVTMAYLHQPSTAVGSGTNSRYYPCGLLTELHTSDPGNQSLNRMASPQSKSSDYALGYEQPGNRPVRVFYHAGVLNGFECCLYIMPNWRTFLIVHTNTSGRVDATDHISRIILQHLFDLQPLKGQRVNIPEMAKLGVEERAKLLREFAESQSASDNVTAIHPSHLVGTYRHNNYRQTILVTERDDRLWVRWRGSREIDGEPVLSDDMQLLRINAQRVRMKVRFTIDRFDAWRDLDFMVSRDGNQQVTALSRKDPNSENKVISYARSL